MGDASNLELAVRLAEIARSRAAALGLEVVRHAFVLDDEDGRFAFTAEEVGGARVDGVRVRVRHRAQSPVTGRTADVILDVHLADALWGDDGAAAEVIDEELKRASRSLEVAWPGP